MPVNFDVLFEGVAFEWLYSPLAEATHPDGIAGVICDYLSCVGTVQDSNSYLKRRERREKQ